MTLKVIEESAATAADTEAAPSDSASTAAPAAPFEVAEPGRFLASLFLTAALVVGPNFVITTEAATTRGRRRDAEACETSTDDEDVDPALVTEVGELFDRGASEFFEDGMHSAFSRALLAFLALHGKSGFQAIAEYLSSDEPNPAVVSEALRWLGDFGDEATLRERWTILQQMLRHRSPTVRDGAILGFAAMDHPRSKPVLIQAREAEHIAELRQLIQQVIEQLEATKHALPPVDRRQAE